MMKNLRNKLNTLPERKVQFLFGVMAIILLLGFQWFFHFQIVDYQKENLLPIKHHVVLNTFKGVDNLTLKSNAVKDDKIDSVEIVKDHFFDFNVFIQFLLSLILPVVFFAIFRKKGTSLFLTSFFILLLTIFIFSRVHSDYLNITAQLLLLSILEIGFFWIFWKMEIYPTPFLLPLFIILTISIFYHNYLGDGLGLTDRLSVPIESVSCRGNCKDFILCNHETEECDKIPDEYITKLPCIENKKICDDIPDEDKNKYIFEENGVEIVNIVKIDKQKMKNKLDEVLALGIYGEEGKSITLDQTQDVSDINKYRRASKNSKEHFKYLMYGFLCFLISMLLVKYVSSAFGSNDLFRKFPRLREFPKLRKFPRLRKFFESDDLMFRFILLLFLLVVMVIGGLIYLKYYTTIHVPSSLVKVTSFVEVLKLLAIFLTIIGYEKINKNGWNLWLYISALILSGMVILVAKDLGNALILGIIVLLVLFIAHPWKKKVFGVIILLIIVALIVPAYIFFIQDYEMRWRFKDTWNIDKPLYRCEVAEEDKEFSEEIAKAKQTSSKKSFFSTEEKNEICYEVDDDNKIAGFKRVKNCTDSEDKNFKKCKRDNFFLEILGVDDFKCDTKNYKSLNCHKQVNNDTRLAIFAILKDGLLSSPDGFKENTFLLNNRYMYTDFVFCGLIAFFGLPVMILVIGSLFILILNCRVKPKQCGNNYKHFLYSNIMITILATQALIHIGGNLNVIPFTGVILPFLSRGGASTIVSFCTLGFALGGFISDQFMSNILSKIRSFFNH